MGSIPKTKKKQQQKSDPGAVKQNLCEAVF
jgi:hypothetical protein